MRVTRRAIDTAAQPWETLSEVLQRKVLNGDPESGPHTLILRSGPRAPGPDFAQYHPVDEELFALDGDFTFDGSTWFRAGSYAFYPAFFVHGTNVHVRGGYEVYLRLSGVSELFRVDAPESDAPYFVGEGTTEACAMQLADAAAETSASKPAAGLRLHPLHRDPSASAGSTLLTASEAGHEFDLASSGLLELFVLSGTFRLPGGEVLPRHGYHCEVAAAPSLTLRCEEPGSIMISHDGEMAAG